MRSSLHWWLSWPIVTLILPVSPSPMLLHWPYRPKRSIRLPFWTSSCWVLQERLRCYQCWGFVSRSDLVVHIGAKNNCLFAQYEKESKNIIEFHRTLLKPMSLWLFDVLAFPDNYLAQFSAGTQRTARRWKTSNPTRMWGKSGSVKTAWTESSGKRFGKSLYFLLMLSTNVQ